MELNSMQAKIDEMLLQVNDTVRIETTRLFKSGGISANSYHNDEYILPKILLTIALNSCADDYKPLADPHKKDMKNLSRF